MSRRRRRRAKERARVEHLLDELAGPRGRRAGAEEEDRDGRGERGPREWGRGAVRTLDLHRNSELFAALVQQDFEYLLAQNFAAGRRTLADLLPQSVLGRAQNGHGWFTDEFGTALQFPDATFDRILTVLEQSDPNLKCYLVRERRGRMLQRFEQWLFERLDEPELELVIDGAPVFGIDFLADRVVETRAFLTGLVLAGFMDDWTTRQTAMMQHKKTFDGLPFAVGGGEIWIVDRERFEMCGLRDPGGVVLLDEQLRTLRDLGVLMRDPEGEYRYPEHDQEFFRRRLGDGVSDDLALLWIGARFGYDALLGAFLMDAIDTYDKFVVEATWGGFDTRLARRLQNRFLDHEGAQLVDDRHLLDLIHFAAKRNDPPLNLSSSHRRLIQIERDAAIPTLLNHWRFLQGEPVHDIKLGYSRIPSADLYDCARARLRSIGVDVPEVRFLPKRARQRD